MIFRSVFLPDEFLFSLTAVGQRSKSFFIAESPTYPLIISCTKFPTALFKPKSYARFLQLFVPPPFISQITLFPPRQTQRRRRLAMNGTIHGVYFHFLIRTFKDIHMGISRSMKDCLHAMLFHVSRETKETQANKTNQPKLDLRHWGLLGLWCWYWCWSWCWRWC